MGRSDIYGVDETSMASSIASDALTNTAGTEEYWAKGIDQSARSKGAGDNFNPDVETEKQKGDSRAKTTGNH